MRPHGIDSTSFLTAILLLRFIRGKSMTIFQIFLSSALTLSAGAADEWPEKGIAPSKEWKSQRLCDFEIYYPFGSLLDVPNVETECPSMFRLAMNRLGAIQFYVDIIEAADWPTEASRAALSH